MLADFELNEINRLNFVIKQERARLASLLQMLRTVDVDAWLDPDGEITVVNRALESPHPIGSWPWCRLWGTDNIGLGAGYTGLGAGGT